MLVSNFTSATFAVVKKYTQLACIFMSKISHREKTSKFPCQKSVCKSSCKNSHTSFLHGLYVEIRHMARNLCTCKCSNACSLYCNLLENCPYLRVRSYLVPGHRYKMVLCSHSGFLSCLSPSLPHQQMPFLQKEHNKELWVCEKVDCG